MDISDEVERLSKRRRIILMLFAGSFLIWQIPMMDTVEAMKQAGAFRAVDIVKIAGFGLWIVALMALFLFFGRRASNPEVRAALEDELTRANRAKAFSFGYWLMLFVAGLVYVLTLLPVLEITNTDVAHVMIMAAVLGPIFRFLKLERASE